MSDLSSNSMTREDMIRAARANCLRQIDNPAGRGGTEEIKTAGKEMISPVKKGTLVRLFFAGVLFLAGFAVKQYHISYHQYDQTYLQNALESNQEFDGLQEKAALLLEKKIIPVFHRLDT